MGQIIEVPGMGQIEFPDGMKDAEIVSAIKNLQMQPKEQTAAPKADASTWQGKALATETNPVQLAVNAIPDSVRKPIDTGINWLGTQFTKGLTGIAGAPYALGTLADRGASYLGDKAGMPELGANLGAALKSNLTMNGLAPSAESLNDAIFTGLRVPEVNAGDSPALTLTNPLGLNARVNVGKMLDVGAQAVPGAAVLGGGALPAFTGGITSEAAGQATAGTPWELPARIFGAIPGAYIGTKLTTPLPANLTPQQQRAVDLAKANGVPLSVGQETGRGVGVERFLSRMPGGQGVSEKFAGKQGAVTDAMALKEAGFVGNETGQETMKALARQAGDEFAAAKNMPGLIDLTPTFPRVRQAVAEYEGVMDPAKRSPAVANEAGRILSKEPGPTQIAPLPAAEAISRTPTAGNLKTAIQNAGKSVDEAFDALPTDTIGSWFRKGPMAPMPKDLPELSNQQYQTLRKGLSDSIAAIYKGGMGKDTNAAEALKAMRTALDDAAEASLGPDKLAAWQQARRHYAAFKTIQKAMDSGTAQARSEGTLGAGALTSALRRVQGDKFYETTGGLNDVATIKGYLRDTFPNSGTPTIMAGAANVAGLGLPALGTMLAQKAMTGTGPVASMIRNYLANQTIPNVGQSVATAPFTLTPQLLNDQRLRLPDQRGQ